MNMQTLEWSDALALGNATMDDTHREFVALLNAVAAAADADLLARLDDFVAHTERHFGEEERWMEATNFPPRGCHQGEHQNVLEIAREVRNRVAAGDVEYARKLADALAEWFPVHATTMDAMLAEFMKQLGYEPGCS